MKNQPIKKRKVTDVIKQEFSYKKGNLIVGSVNIIIIEVTMIIYYHYPVQLKIAIVEYFQIYLIIMTSM